MAVQMQPIREMERVHDITVTLSKLRDRRGKRMFLMWVVGINLGLRVSDLIDLKVGQLRDENVFTYLPKKQAHKKGARPISIPIPAAVRKVLKARLPDADPEAWLFPSRTRSKGKNAKPISRQTARMDMREIGRVCGLTERIGCHTMRKTFGYHYYQRSHDIAILQEWFYHESPATTLIYIGVALDNFRKMVSSNPFGDMDGVEL